MAEVSLQIGSALLDAATRSHSNLSLVIAKDRFFYSISKGRQLLYLEVFNLGTDSQLDFTQEIRSIILEHKLLKPGFKSVTVGYDHPAFTFTPVSLYSAGFDQTYIESSLYIPSRSIIKRDTLSNLEVIVQYASLRDVDVFIKSTFPNVRSAHFVSSLLLATSKQLPSQEKQNSVFLHVIGLRCYICVYRDTSLILANHYQTQTINDIVYYTLMLYEQLLLKTDTDILTVSGDITLDSKLYSSLHTFIRHIEIARVQIDASDELKYPQLVFGITELQQCAS